MDGSLKDFIYTMDDICLFFKTKPHNVRRWIRAGKFPKPIKVGGSSYWKREHILTVMNINVQKVNDNVHNSTEMYDNVQKKTFDFEAIYKLYPKKRGKKKGMQRCLSQIDNQKKYDQLTTAILNYKEEVKNTDIEFIKQFDTFMNCWEDWVEVECLEKTTHTEDETFSENDIVNLYPDLFKGEKQ